MKNNNRGMDTEGLNSYATKSPNAPKTITVSTETWQGLTKIKYAHLFDTIDDVILYLLRKEVKA